VTKRTYFDEADVPDPIKKEVTDPRQTTLFSDAPMASQPATKPTTDNQGENNA
jgi:hypothetical protein